MILTAHAIQQFRQLGQITIQPFAASNLGTVSYKFSLGDHIIRVDRPQDSQQPLLNTVHTSIPPTGRLLHPGIVYLASTYEKLGSACFAQMIFCLKRMSNLGIYLDISANLGHTGALTHWTLEITVIKPTIIYPRQLIGQITFWYTYGETDLYRGKYNHKVLPEKSLLWQE